MAKRNYKATEASNKHLREIAPIEFPGSKTFDVYEGFEADVEFYFEKYNQDVKDGVSDPNVDVVEYIAGRIDEKYPTENPMQFDSLIGEVRALLPKIDKDWYANMYNPKRVKEGKEQMEESKVSSSYVKQLETDRRYYERTADGHWEAEDWTIANEYYARANFLSLLEKYYAAKLNNDTEGELKAAETLYKVYTDPEFLVENFYIKKDKEEDKCIYQRAIKPGFLGELKNWDEGDTLIEGIYPDAYDNFVSEVLPEIEKLLDKEHWYFRLVESKLMDEGNSLWWKSEAYQESKTKNRKQRIKEDSLDDPDIDLSQSFKGKDLDRLEEFQNDAINFIGAIVEGELQEKGFRKVKFPKKDGYRIFVGGLFSKKIAEPGSNIYITLEIGEYGKIRVGEVDYSAEDLANELCDIIKPLMNGVRFDVYQIYQASIYGDSGQWIIRFNCEVPEDILDETKWIARESKTFKFVEAKLQRAKDISKLLNEASERSDCEQAFFDWFESQAPHYDVSNYDAFEAGARAKGVEVQEENYMAWLEQFAPHYDVSGYDAFEAGWNLA